MAWSGLSTRVSETKPPQVVSAEDTAVNQRWSQRLVGVASAGWTQTHQFFNTGGPKDVVAREEA